MRSRHRPPTVWLDRHRVRWEPAGGRPGRDVVGVQLRHGGVGDAARAGWAILRSRAPERLTPEGDDPDVVYAPWINALVDDPALFDLGAPVVTSCRGALVTIAPWDPARPAYRAALAEVFARSTRVHCVSEAILERGRRARPRSAPAPG